MRLSLFKPAALTVGVNPLYSALPSYVIIMGGGGLVNFAYCFIRLAFKKDLSLKADLALPGATLFKNGALAATGGIMWYLQFFFYAWGAASIPASFAYVNWMLHMSGYVLFGGIVGLALGEWAGVGSKPVRLLWAGMLVIIAAANIVGLGMGVLSFPAASACNGNHQLLALLQLDRVFKMNCRLFLVLL